MEEKYRRTAALLLRILPFINAEERFALKGGTAINFFHWNLPRFSVDVDLVYLPVQPRKESLEGIEEGLRSIARRIESSLPNAKILLSKNSDTKTIAKAVVRSDNAEVIIEPSLVLRGALLPPRAVPLCNEAQSAFQLDMSVRCVSEADLFGGKLCAAVDRQHPRDLFDVKLLLEREGISDAIRAAFVVYIASGDRPFDELLKPSLQPLEPAFTSQFLGMTVLPVTVDDLIAARAKLLSIIPASLSANERQFLLSLMQLDPKWDLLPFPGVDQLPAIRWKLLNIEKMEATKRRAATERLERVLS